MGPSFSPPFFPFFFIPAVFFFCGLNKIWSENSRRNIMVAVRVITFTHTLLHSARESLRFTPPPHLLKKELLYYVCLARVFWSKPIDRKGVNRFSMFLMECCFLWWGLNIWNKKIKKWNDKILFFCIADGTSHSFEVCVRSYDRKRREGYMQIWFWPDGVVRGGGGLTLEVCADTGKLSFPAVSLAAACLTWADEMIPKVQVVHKRV